jgi:DNA-binding transcriptional regulator YiaG
VFAQVLNVNPETVKAWEQGKRQPDGAASRLLELASQTRTSF